MERRKRVAAKAPKERPVESMIRGLREATNWAAGRDSDVSVTKVHPIDVSRIRRRTTLSQAAFAAKFGFSVGAVQNWEQGRRVPERSGRILLAIVDSNPEVVEAALTAVS